MAAPPEIRIVVLERDGHKCTRCGNDGDMVVHHILPESEDGTHDLENLTTLCWRCHKVVHLDRGDWYADNMMSRNPRRKLQRKVEKIYFQVNACALMERFKITERQADILAVIISNRCLGMLLDVGELCDQSNLDIEIVQSELKVLKRKTKILGTCETGNKKSLWLFDDWSFAVEKFRESELPPEVLASFASAD